jgi:hypothetical protein
MLTCDSFAFVPIAAGSTLGICTSNPDRFCVGQLGTLLDNLVVRARTRDNGNAEYPMGECLPVGPMAAPISGVLAHLIFPFFGQPGATEIPARENPYVCYSGRSVASDLTSKGETHAGSP